MEKQESQSNWDDLARELGAEISPETQQREEAISLASQEAASVSTPQSRETKPAAHAPLPKRNPTDWNSLAGELGLPPTESVPAAEVEEALQETEVRPEPRQRERESERTRRPQRHDRERRPRRESSEERREGRGQRGRGGRRERRHEHRRPDEEPEREEQFPAEVEIEARSGVEEAEIVAPARSEEPPPKPAVSLWHKIFGSPAEQSAKLTEDVGPPEPVAPSDLRDEPRSAGSGFADTLRDELSEPHEEIDEFAPHAGRPVEGSESAQSDRGRNRSRRRRGRGRGRKPESGREMESRGEGPRPEPALAAIEDEFGDSQFIDDESAEPSFETETLDAEGNDGVDSGAAGPRRSSALQRAIPSWDEAIGFIVEANMQTRSQRRPSTRSGSRDNSSRGRSRGRRKS